jgi:hypothetical protein
MSELIRTLDRARRVCATLAVLLTAGCSLWRPLPGADLSCVGSERLGHAKVFMRDGTELELEEATISPDSISGLGGDTRTRMAVARSEVVSVDTRQTNGPATFLVGGLIPFAFLLLATVAYVVVYHGHID